MNLTNVTINVSRNAKKELTPEQQKQNAFMKMSPAKKWEFIYEMLMDHEDRISALESDIEPEPTPDPNATNTPSPEPTERMVWISDTGNKYHNKSSCSNMDDPRQVTESWAESHGYEPCGRCGG